MKYCKGICHRYPAPPRTKGGDRYTIGQKRCGVCECWMGFEGFICPCCKSLVRTRPESKQYRDKYNAKMKPELLEMIS